MGVAFSLHARIYQAQIYAPVDAMPFLYFVPFSCYFEH